MESIEAAALALREGCESYGVPGAQLGLMRGDERVVVCAGVASDASRSMCACTASAGFM